MTELRKLNIAVIGSGISGLSAAWLLSKSHNVTLFEKNEKFGGHSNTVKIAKGYFGKNPEILQNFANNKYFLFFQKIS